MEAVAAPSSRAPLLFFLNVGAADRVSPLLAFLVYQLLTELDSSNKRASERASERTAAPVTTNSTGAAPASTSTPAATGALPPSIPLSLPPSAIAFFPLLPPPPSVSVAATVFRAVALGGRTDGRTDGRGRRGPLAAATSYLQATASARPPSERASELASCDRLTYAHVVLSPLSARGGASQSRLVKPILDIDLKRNCGVNTYVRDGQVRRALLANSRRCFSSER